MIDRAVDRLLNRTVSHGPVAVRPEVAAFHAAAPVVDLLVGTPLFRRSFLERLGHGHVDLPRAREGGLDLVAFTIATRFPDLRGTLSAPHFAALGIPVRRLGDDLAIAEAFLDRIDGWIAASAGRLAWCPARRCPSPVMPFAASPGSRAARCWATTSGASSDCGPEGVRMLALAHVMDTPLAGSGTGRGAGG